jgi:hypothetical protein
MPFADARRGIVVAQDFEVVDGKDLSLTLHLDLRRSVTETKGADGTGYQFGPVVTLLNSGEDSSLTGTVSDTAVTEVCAYLERRPPPTYGPNDPHVDDPGDSPGPGNLPPSLIVARMPPSFANGTAVAPDTDSTCANAFATAVVTNGSYTLEHLIPGNYEMVFFHADGTSAKLVAKAPVAPGQQVDAGAAVSEDSVPPEGGTPPGVPDGAGIPVPQGEQWVSGGAGGPSGPDLWGTRLGGGSGGESGRRPSPQR